MSFEYRYVSFLPALFDFADLVCDWLVYVDVSLTEKGLVYGPHGEGVVYSLLLFSIVGTALFLFATVNLWRYIFRVNPYADVDLVSAITIWLEDLPQICINVYIVWCRETAKNYFLLSKAAVMIIGVVARLICRLVIYFRKRLSYKFHKHRIACRALVITGLVILGGLAAYVLVLTQTHRKDTGDVEFQVPDTFLGDKYDDQRYFQNVSVFVHFPEFDSAHVVTSKSSHVTWLRLMSINEMQGNADDTISYKYGYQTTLTDLQMALWKRMDKAGQRRNDSWELRECVRLDVYNGSLTMISTDVCQSPTFITNLTYVYVTFSFVKPDHDLIIFKKRVFGDIRYNIKVGNGSQCQDYDVITDDINQASNKTILYYFHTSLNTTTSHLVQDAGGPRFFRNDGHDLTDVATLWKTGWGRCESSGNRGPTLHRDLVTGCNNTDG